MPASTRIVSFRELLANHFDAPTLTEATGFAHSYGTNPYAGYDGESHPFLFSGTLDSRLPTLTRVVTQDRGGRRVAIQLSALAGVGPANLAARGKDVTVFWTPETASARSAESIRDAADSGSAPVYESRLVGALLSFRRGEQLGTFIDEQTGSTWNIFGKATAG